MIFWSNGESYRVFPNFSVFYWISKASFKLEMVEIYENEAEILNQTRRFRMITGRAIANGLESVREDLLTHETHA